LIKGDTREPFLKVEILDVAFYCAIALVLQELCNGFVDFGPQHFLGITALFIVSLAVIVHITSDNIVSNQGRLGTFRV
jgi:hypothetical protein